MSTIHSDRSIAESPLSNGDLAPTEANRRTWGTYDFAALWVGLSIVTTTYTLASGLIAAGMTWWQGLLTVSLGNLIVLIPMLLNAHPGTKYGIPFPVLVRSSFGIRGANVAAMARALVACGWFGIQTWIGALAQLEQLDHRRVRQLPERHAEARVLRRGEPGRGVARELLRGPPRVELEQDAGDRLEAELLRAREVAGQQRLDHRLLAQLGVRSHRLAEAGEHEQRLEVRRLLAPQGAVVVEHGDALGGRHVVRTALLRHAIDELEDRRPRGPVVPGREAHRPDVMTASSLATTWSIVKLAASWRGGNSTNVWRNCAVRNVAARMR